MKAASVNYRDLQAQRTRTQIISTFRDLMCDSSYAELSISEVVKATGMTRGAFYGHFKTKRDVFEALFEDTLSELIERLDQPTADLEDDFDLRVQAAAEIVVEFLSQQQVAKILAIEAPAVMGAKAWLKAFDQHITATLVKVFERYGHGIDSVSIVPLAQLTGGAFHAVALRLSIQNNRKSREAMVQSLSLLMQRLRG